MFKFTLECTGQLPPVNLKKPSMAFICKNGESSKEGISRSSAPKAVLFEDHKKSDLFDFEEGDIQSDDHPAASKFEHDEETGDDIKRAPNSDLEEDHEESDLFQ